MLLAEFLPSRSTEDILAERVRLNLGREEFILPDLSIEATEAWQAQFATELGVIYAQIGQAKQPADVMVKLLGLVPLQLTLIRGYDTTGVLPADEWIRGNASASAVLKSFIEVLAAAHPTAGVLLDAVVRNPDLIRTLLREGTLETTSPPPTNGSHPPTGGKRVRSGAK